MESKTRIVSPGPQDRTVRTDQGEVLRVPPGWVLLPPGDPGATRRFKAAGPTWTMEQRKGRKRFSLGVWGPGATLEKIQRDLQAERGTEAYAKRRAASSARREKKQEAYVEDFHGAVLQFLRFDLRFRELAERLAAAVTAHATPVGSGTVARTERIPIERRAESAVIAWMRHQTTAYDSLRIPRVRGARREVRQQLAQQSRRLLARYRTLEATEPRDSCPLVMALEKPSLQKLESAKTLRAEGMRSEPPAGSAKVSSQPTRQLASAGSAYPERVPSHQTRKATPRTTLPKPDAKKTLRKVSGVARPSKNPVVARPASNGFGKRPIKSPAVRGNAGQSTSSRTSQSRVSRDDLS